MPGTSRQGRCFDLASSSQGEIPMKMKLLITALVIAGFAGSTIMSTTADAKTRKHHKSSMTTTGTGTGSGMNKGNAANPSGQGNVGPGTSNNAGPNSGGK
jgi:hypothetical protein